jgi:hypothetical protein
VEKHLQSIKLYVSKEINVLGDSIMTLIADSFCIYNDAYNSTFSAMDWKAFGGRENCS